jgi:hypothetical protein
LDTQLKTIACGALAGLLLSSCSGTAPEGAVVKPPQVATKFPALKNVNAEFDCVSPRRTFYTDEDVKLTFRLTNFSDRKLLIYEWMRRQEDNVRIRYHLASGEEAVPPFAEWKLIAPIIPADVPPPRQSLDLTTSCSTLIDKTFKLSDFGLGAGDISGDRFMLIVGELNLQSLRLSSKPVKIQIRRRAAVINE